MPEESLPSFRKPPVVETVLGVQFDALGSFCNAHLGAFWKYLQEHDAHDQWCSAKDVPPIEPAFERFGEERTWGPELMLRINQIASRLQIRSAAGDAMVQVQNGRLHYNWIGHAGQAYPRYSLVQPRFDRIQDVFLAFLREEGLGELRPIQWEVTYVNHIPKGTVWNEPEDWSSVFVGLPGVRSCPAAVRLEGLSGAWHFEIPERRGRVHVDLKHAKLREPASKEILRLTFTARGPVAETSTGKPALAEGLDLGHRAIVVTFRDITSSEAHRYWEMEE